ncbi:MAG: tetratricopeptide repeat protein [Hyphomicrobiales bacterium]
MRNPFGGAAGPRLLAVLLLALVVFGCAYYNTFYLAKKYYREGQKAQEKSLTGGVSPDAAGRFDATIRQCNKILTEYPNSKYVDDALYLMGAALYGKGDYSGAIRRLDELMTRFPKSPFVPDARFVQGLSYLKRKDFTVADSVFHAIDADYPKFARKWELYFNEGENKALQDDIPAALWWYRRAIGVAKERHQRSDALRRAGDALVQADRLDSAQTVYDECLRVEDRPGTRLDVALSRGAALRDLKRYQVALDFLNNWRSTAQAEQREGELYLRIDELLALLGRTQDAIDGYRQLVDKYPHTNVAYEAQFQIGYLYESALSDFDQAAKEYDKLRSEPESEFKSQAARRSASLTTLKQYRAALEADTTGARARSAFRVAELYYFELGKTDSAMMQYRAVERQFPHSVYAPKSAYARLWITAIDRNDTTDAMAMTDTMATKYKGTRFAESALYLWKQWSGRTDDRTALLDTLMAHPDTSAASLYVEEKEPEPAPPAVATPTSTAADSGVALSAQELKRLQERAQEMKRPRRDRPLRLPKREWTPANLDTVAAAASGDSLAAAADSTGAAADSAGVGAAPPDSARARPGATGGAAGSEGAAPADTIQTYIITPSR